VSATRWPHRHQEARCGGTWSNGRWQAITARSQSWSTPRSAGIEAPSWIGRLTSPDGQTLITYFGGDVGSGWTIRRIDLASGGATPMIIGDDLSWQRLALPR
jgi:hypothetical protein